MGGKVSIESQNGSKTLKDIMPGDMRVYFKKEGGRLAVFGLDSGIEVFNFSNSIDLAIVKLGLRKGKRKGLRKRGKI